MQEIARRIAKTADRRYDQAQYDIRRDVIQ
jgi:hypothetical protein